MSTIIIPARTNSTRLSNKINLTMPNGKTMVEWVHDKALNTIANEVYVATNSIYVSGYFEKSILTSDKCENGTARIAEAIKIKQIPENELIINWQADEITLETNHINQLINYYNNLLIKPHILTAHIEIDRPENNNPNEVKLITKKDDEIDNQVIYFSRSHIPYNSNKIKKHIGIYLYTAKTIIRYSQLENTPLSKQENLEQLKALEHGMIIQSLELKPFEHISIDTDEDYQLFMKYSK